MFDHLLTQSERQQRNRDQHDGSKGEEQASAQAHLLSRIVYRCNHQSPIPFRGHAGPTAPHDRLQPCLDQRDDGLGIEPWSAIHQDLQVLARINRPAVDGRHVTSIGSPPLCPCQGLTGQPGGALVCPAWTVRKERIEKRRCGRTRRTDQAHKALGQIPRRAVARVVYDSRNGRGVVSRRRECDLAIRHHLPPERTARPPRLSSNRIVGENLPRVLRQRRRRARAAWCKKYAGSLPCQRHGSKLRKRGCVLERRGIPCKQ